MAMPTIQIYTLYHNGKMPHQPRGPFQLLDVESTHWAPYKSFGEMRGHYFIWECKIESDYIGFQHYRRWFMLDRIGTTVPAIADSKLFYEYENHSELPDITKFDGIIPIAWKFETNIEEQYRSSHDFRDWEVFAEREPELAQIARNQNHYYPCNIFILKWNLFCKYMEFWWDLITEIYPKMQRLTGYQERNVAFLSERIFSLWIQRETINENLNIAQAPLIMDLTR